MKLTSGVNSFHDALNFHTSLSESGLFYVGSLQVPKVIIYSMSPETPNHPSARSNSCLLLSDPIKSDGSLVQDPPAHDLSNKVRKSGGSPYDVVEMSRPMPP